MESKKTYSQETIHLLKIVYFSGEKKEKKGKETYDFCHGILKIVKKNSQP